MLEWSSEEATKMKKREITVVAVPVANPNGTGAVPMTDAEWAEALANDE